MFLVLLFLLLSLSLSLLLLVYPPHTIDKSIPLPWDMSGHYLNALEMGNALHRFSPAGITRSLFHPDLYPPGYYILLGTWLAVFGESATSQILFHLFVLGLLLVSFTFCSLLCGGSHRVGILVLSVVFLLGTGRILALAGTYMVEIPVTALCLGALCSLALLGEAAGRMKFLLAYALMTGTLLTKYSTGLPLLPAAFLLALLCLLNGQRRESLLLVLALAAAAITWAAFLTLQNHGWSSFLQFARNRSNSAGWSCGARALWYWRLYVSDYAASAGWAIGVAAFALVGAAGMSGRFGPVAACYVLCTMGALSCHDYLLDRNLVVIAVLLAMLAAMGLVVVAAWLRRRVRWCGRGLLATTCALGLAVTALGVGVNRDAAVQYYRVELGQLAPVTDCVADLLRRGQTCRVIGTFNEFSPGWVKLLWVREGKPLDAGLALEFPYPLNGARNELGYEPDPAYDRLVEDWVRAGADDLVITLQVRPGSTWDTEDYRKWNKWKENVTSALSKSTAFALVEEQFFPEAGIEVRAFRVLPALHPRHAGV
jgi:4-amino-4-deoxy-L-arabinose transferase-like glycosyltransferase